MSNLYSVDQTPLTNLGCWCAVIELAVGDVPPSVLLSELGGVAEQAVDLDDVGPL